MGARAKILTASVAVLACVLGGTAVTAQEATVVLLVTDNPTDRLIAETAAPWWVAIGGYDARPVDAADVPVNKIGDPERVCIVTIGANANDHATSLRARTDSRVVVWQGADRWDTARGIEGALQGCY